MYRKRKQKKPASAAAESLTYLKTVFEDGRLYFYAESDALISARPRPADHHGVQRRDAGSDSCVPPAYLEELGIRASLSPGRANGLTNILLRVRQEAVKRLPPSTFAYSNQNWTKNEGEGCGQEVWLELIALWAAAAEEGETLKASMFCCAFSDPPKMAKVML